MTSSDVGWHHNSRSGPRWERSAPGVAGGVAAGGQRPKTRDRSRSGRGGVTVELEGRAAGSCAPRTPPLPLPGVAMESWIVWLVLAAVLGVAEIMTTTLAFGLIAAGAVVAGIVGVAGAGLPFQLIAFAVASAAGLGVVRPIAVRHIKQPP